MKAGKTKTTPRVSLITMMVGLQSRVVRAHGGQWSLIGTFGGHSAQQLQ